VANWGMPEIGGQDWQTPLRVDTSSMIDTSYWPQISRISSRIFAKAQHTSNYCLATSSATWLRTSARNQSALNCVVCKPLSALVVSCSGSTRPNRNSDRWRHRNKDRT
jgi:hypothetical protein